MYTGLWNLFVVLHERTWFFFAAGHHVYLLYRIMGALGPCGLQTTSIAAAASLLSEQVQMAPLGTKGCAARGVVCPTDARYCLKQPKCITSYLIIITMLVNS